VLIHATAQAADITPVYAADDFWYEPMSQIAADLFAVSEAQRGDLAFAQLYDNFTPTILFTLEGMGFCEAGEGGDWISAERIGRQGGWLARQRRKRVRLAWPGWATGLSTAARWTS